MDVEMTRKCAALCSIKLQNISSNKRSHLWNHCCVFLTTAEYFYWSSMVRKTHDLRIGRTINVLIASHAYRQPHLPLAAHKVQLPSKIAKLYEIQFTLGICLFDILTYFAYCYFWLLAKQQSIHTLLAQNSHGQIIPGHLMYAVRVPFLGELPRKIHETSS